MSKTGSETWAYLTFRWIGTRLGHPSRLLPLGVLEPPRPQSDQGNFRASEISEACLLCRNRSDSLLHSAFISTSMKLNGSQPLLWAQNHPTFHLIWKRIKSIRGQPAIAVIRHKCEPQPWAQSDAWHLSWNPCSSKSASHPPSSRSCPRSRWRSQIYKKANRRSTGSGLWIWIEYMLVLS